MTAAPAPTRPPTRWLPLDDHPAALCPLELGIVRLAVHGHARTLLRALNLPDPDDLSGRLLAVHGGRVHVHAGHLATLGAALGPEQTAAFHAALGLAAGPDEPAPPAPRPRPDLLHRAALGPERAGPGPRSPGGPATDLTRAMQRVADDPDVLAAYNAALTTEILRAVCWHWLDQRAALHLELLSGIDRPTGPGRDAADAALQQVLTTLSGARRSAARTVIETARAQHAALAAHHAAQRAARRDVIRTAVRAAAQLAADGWLTRAADARWLTPTELRDALDGTLDPGTLRGVTQLRRLQHAPAPGVPTWTLVDRSYAGTPVAPGVRDGTLHVWVPGQPVPDGCVALCADVRPWQWAQLDGAAAVILDRAGPLSPAAVHERAAGRPAVGLRGRRPEWLQPGAVVRVNAHQGTVTVLRRADSHTADSRPIASHPAAPDPRPAPPVAVGPVAPVAVVPPDSVAAAPALPGAAPAPAVAAPVAEPVPAVPGPAAPPPPAVPAEIATLRLDFDLS